MAATCISVLVGSERLATALLPEEEDPHLDERTALTLGGQTLKVGILALEYGITDRINLGIDPPLLIIRVAEPIIVPNVHVKAIAYQRERLWLTGEAALYYADVSRGGSSGNLYVVPLSAFASYQLSPIVWLHGELTYDMVYATGSGDLNQTTLGGAATTRGVQLGAMAEYRLRPTIALTLRGRLQVYTGRLAFNGSNSPDEFTTVAIDGRLTPRESYPWQIVPGVAFLWQRVRLTVGLGYGNYFVPGLDIPLSGKSFVPDASLAVLF